MNVAEELAQLETVDVCVSQRLVHRWKSSLNASRNAEVICELVDYYLSTNSTNALRILVALKDVHSQVCLLSTL